MNRQSGRIYLVLAILGLSACATKVTEVSEGAATGQAADQLMVVDCLLPGKVKKLGQAASFITARQPIKTTMADCAIRGGEYTAFDRADYATSLKIWLPAAQAGDAEAQAYVGEIYEKGLGLAPDYELAAAWYKKAADQGLTRAQINLGNLYEKGLGVEQDSVAALNWYRKASGIDTDKLQFASTLIDQEKLAAEVGKLQSDVQQLQDYKNKNEAAIKAKQQELAAQRLESAKTKTEVAAVTNTKSKYAPPSIQIIDPPISLTRSGPSALLRNAVKEREVIGKVEAPAGVSQFMVNGEKVNLDEFNLFFLNVPITSKRTQVSMSAIDQQEQVAGFDFTMFVDSTQPSAATVEHLPSQNVSSTAAGKYGQFYALVIGNNQYANYAQLETAVEDASAVARVLNTRYGFDTRLLLNANRYEILTAINDLRDKLTEKDNLLIYYAGHGELDEANDRGYWLPVDAEPGSSANWLANTAISDQLNTMKAKHVMVVADSCYAGTLSTASVARQNLTLSDADVSEWLEVMAEIKARTVLTAGGVRPVLDSGGGKHSVFAKAFIHALETNQRILDGNSLFVSILSDVRRNSSAMAHEQVPDYGAIKYSGHEAGEFFLFPKTI